MDRKLLAVDAACLLVYLVAASPALTGIGIHEWLGLGVLVVFFAHAAMHVDWAVEAVRSAFARPSWARTGNLALDLLIVAAFMMVTVSGIMVSGAVLPALGLVRGRLLLLGSAARDRGEGAARAAARARRGALALAGRFLQERERGTSWEMKLRTRASGKPAPPPGSSRR